MKRNTKVNPPFKEKKTIAMNKPGNAGSALFPYMNYKLELIVLAVVALALYANTFFGDYVLDDVMSVSGNKFVMMGFAGIKKIFSTDGFAGFVDSGDTLQGGRYRPLALVTFAIEIGLWGRNPYISHLINILIWIFTSLSFFYLLKNILFRSNPDVAFIAALIFIIHPIHTEVVANIKSRDELLSLMFLILSSISIFKYINRENSNKKNLWLSLVFYFLALLSKENAIAFVFLLPLMIHCFTQLGFGKILRLKILFACVLVLYLLIRFSVTGLHTGLSHELLNNPFLYATPATQMATIMFCLLKYVQLLFFPYPQSYDYSFNQIPLTDFSNPVVIVSILIYSALFVFGILKIGSRNVLAFCALFYLVSIFIVSNLLVNVGALIGERFLYQPSIAFSIFIGYAIVLLTAKFVTNKNQQPLVVVTILIGLCIVMGFRTIKRNHDWNSEYNLYLNDVRVSPNSAVANNYAGIVLVNEADKVDDQSKKNELLAKSIPYFANAATIFNNYPEAYSNAAIALIRMDSLNGAENKLAALRNVNPKSKKLLELDRFIANKFYEKGAADLKSNNVTSAIKNFTKATEHDSTVAEYWFNVAGSNCLNGNFKKGYSALTKALQIKPDYKEALAGLEDLRSKGITSGE